MGGKDSALSKHSLRCRNAIACDAVDLRARYGFSWHVREARGSSVSRTIHADVLFWRAGWDPFLGRKKPLSGFAGGSAREQGNGDSGSRRALGGEGWGGPRVGERGDVDVRSIGRLSLREEGWAR